VLLGLLTDAHPSTAANWTTLTTLPEARFGAAAAGQSGRVYVLGGFTTQISSAVVAWDGTVWSSTNPMSVERLMPGAAAARGSVFALGGFDLTGLPLNSVERFDPVPQTWSGVASMPLPRAAFAVGAVGDSLYVAGGQGEDGMPMADAFRFDPVANAWTPIAPLPTPRTGVAGAVLDRRLWVIGGSDVGPSAAVERFDPQTGSWSSAPRLPEPLWYPAAGTLDGRVWVVGGMDSSFQRSDRVYSAGHDGVWRAEASLPEPLALAAVGSLASCLVVASGMDASGQPSAVAFSQCAAVDSTPAPPPPVDSLTAAVDLTPSTLNAGSQGQWISARITPDGWSALRIVPGSLRLGAVAPDLSGPTSVDSVSLSVKFPRAGFTALPNGLNSLTLTGVLTDGQRFTGTVQVNVQGAGLQAKRRSLRGLATGAVLVSLDQPEDVQIDVLDLQGRVVDHVFRGRLAAGDSRQDWPRSGQSVARGLYFVRLKRSSSTEVVRVAVLPR
jgi:hypothetical protein